MLRNVEATARFAVGPSDPTASGPAPRSGEGGPKDRRGLPTNQADLFYGIGIAAAGAGTPDGHDGVMRKG